MTTMNEEYDEWPILAVNAMTTKLADVELIHAVPSALITPYHVATMCGMKPVPGTPNDAREAIAQLRRFGDVERFMWCPECAKLFMNYMLAGRGAWDGGSL